MRSSIISLGVLASATFVFAPACGSDTPRRATEGSGGASAGATNSNGGANQTAGGSNGSGNSAGVGAGTTGAGGIVGNGTGAAVSVAGAPGTGGSGVVPTTGGVLGMPCQSNANCKTGLTCLTSAGSEFDGGGVPNGLCSLDCSADITAANATTCASLGATVICLQITASTAYCVESCNLGPPVASQTKCQNRRDMACADPGGVGVGYCQPTCRGDFDCAGRTCDLGSGVCTGPISAARKLPIGAKCDPNAMTDICTGACVGVSDGPTSTFGFCSGTCRLGEIGCGLNPATAGARASYCLFPADQASDFGDLGFCAELCDCNDDCANPDFVCSPVQGLSMPAGHIGACGPPDASGDAGRGIACHDK